MRMTFLLFSALCHRRMVCDFSPEDFSGAGYKAGEHAAPSSSLKAALKPSVEESAAAAVRPNPASSVLETVAGVVDVNDGDADVTDLLAMASVAKAVAAAASGRAQIDEDGVTEDESVANQAPGASDGGAATGDADRDGGMLRDFAKRPGSTPPSSAAVTVPLIPTTTAAAATVFRDTEDDAEVEALPIDGGPAAATATGAATPFAHVYGERDILALPAKLVLPDTVLQVGYIAGGCFEVVLF